LAEIYFRSNKLGKQSRESEATGVKGSTGNPPQSRRDRRENAEKAENIRIQFFSLRFFSVFSAALRCAAYAIL